MVSQGEEEDVKRYAFLGWLQTFILAGLITGTSWILGGARPWVILPAFLAVGVLMMIQIIRTILTRDSVLFRFDWVDTWVVLFLVYASARYLSSPVEYIARWEWMTILACAVIFWMARYSLTHSSQGVFLLYILALNGVALAIFSIWLRLNPTYRPFGEDLAQYYAPRMIGPFGCPNHLGDFLLVTSCVTLGLALFTRGLWVVRLGLFYGYGLMIVVLGLTLSRGSWIGLIFALLAITIFCIRHSSLQWFFPLAVYLGMIFVGGFVLSQIPLFASRWNEIQQHLQNHTLDQYCRIQLAHDALKIWKDHFWTGSGLATFNFEDQRYQGPLLPAHAYYTHDDYLNTLADYGLVGGVIVVGFILTVTIYLFRRVDHRAPSARRILLCGAVAAWVGVVFHSFVDFNLHIPACAFLLFLVTGLGLRRSTMAGLHLPYGQQEVVHGFFAVFLAVVLLCFMGKWWQTASGYYPYWQAVAHSSKLEPKVTEVVLPFGQAVDLLTTSTQKDPHADSTLALLGELYEGQAIQAETPAAKQSSGVAAICWFQAALRANPLDDYPMFHLGELYDILGQDDDALFCYRAVIRNQPYNGYFRQALGKHFKEGGKIPEAIECYQDASKCPYGNEGTVEIIAELQSQLPIPIDPYDHPPTLP